MSFSVRVLPSARSLCLLACMFIVFFGLGHLSIHAVKASGGQLRVSPGNLDFQTVFLGQTVTLPFRIENTSLAALHLYRVSSSSGQFSVSGPPLPISLAPSQSVEFKLSFQPIASGKISALLEIVSSVQSMTSFTLTGVGKEPLAALRLSPPSLDFGPRQLNSHSTKKITVRNTGDIPLTISGVTVTGAGFVFSKLSPGLSLAPEEQTVLEVSFHPVSTGTVSGNISILSSSLPSAATAPLAGSSVNPAPQVSTPLSTRSPATVMTAASSTASSIHSSTATTSRASYVSIGTTSTSNISTATTSPPQVLLSWDASSSPVVGYRVYRGTVSGGLYAVQTASAIAALDFTDTSVAAGTTYYYVVSSIDASGVESAYSNQAIATVPSSSVPTPTPTSPLSGSIGLIAGLDLNGSAALNGSSVRLTTTGENLAGSAWYPTPVSVQAFSTDFTFQQANPASSCIADGFAFVIQNVGTTALGPSGGGLGYGPDNPTNPSGSSNTPITNSVAIKFDLYSNAGEGPNSTGIYTNGASPTIPALTLGGGVDLHSGDILHVHMSYDGTTLTMTITDTANTAQSFTTSWPINIPGTVGGSTAYVGFTGGTGGCVSNQDILTWSYSP
jgi:Legume lectin domain/Abnormal spindle-like microcephaly-assoc'd, ASPM-SPD-2-Hydin